LSLDYNDLRAWIRQKMALLEKNAENRDQGTKLQLIGTKPSLRREV